MSDRISLSARGLALGAVVAVLVFAVAGWLFVVGPKRHEAARFADDLAAAELRLAEAQAAAQRPRGAGVSVSDVLRLERAMPEAGDQVGLVLELAALARQSRLTLRSIAPQDPALVAGGASAVPVTVSVRGGFFEITSFLKRARVLVDMNDGRIRVTGRLFAVEEVELVESIETGFPILDATITMNAYVYSGPIAAPGAEDETEPEELQPTGAAAAGGES